MCRSDIAGVDAAEDGVDLAAANHPMDHNKVASFRMDSRPVATMASRRAASHQIVNTNGRLADMAAMVSMAVVNKA